MASVSIAKAKGPVITVSSVGIPRPGTSRVPTVFDQGGIPPWASVESSAPVVAPKTPPKGKSFFQPPPPPPPKVVAKEVESPKVAWAPSSGSDPKGSSSSVVSTRVAPVAEAESAKIIPAAGSSVSSSGLPYKAAPVELRNVKAKGEAVVAKSLLGSASVLKYQVAPVPDRFPPSNPLPSGLAPAVASRPLEVSVSLDYHNTLNCEVAGASTYDGIRTSAANAIASFLARSPNHQVGICSYIGWGGRNSGQKRRELEAAVTYLNRQLQNRGIPLNQLCHLFITSDQNKHPVNSDSCHLHCDDKWSVIQAVQGRGVVGVHFHRQGQFQDIDQVLRHASSQLVPRAFTAGFWGVPHHSYD